MVNSNSHWKVKLITLLSLISLSFFSQQIVPFSTLSNATTCDTVRDRIIYLQWNGSGFVNKIIAPGVILRKAPGTISGLTAGYIPVAASSSTLVNGILIQKGRNVTVPTGKYITGTDTSAATLDMQYGGAAGNAILSASKNTFSSGFIGASTTGSVMGYKASGNYSQISAIEGRNQFASDSVIFDVRDDYFKLNISSKGAGKVLTGDANGVLTFTSPSSISGVVTGTGTQNYVTKWNNAGGTTIGNSILFDNGTNVGISSASPAYKLDVNGTTYSTNVGVNAGLSGRYAYFDSNKLLQAGPLGFDGSVVDITNTYKIQPRGSSNYSYLQFNTTSISIKGGDQGTSGGYSSLILSGTTNQGTSTGYVTDGTKSITETKSIISGTMTHTLDGGLAASGYGGIKYAYDYSSNYTSRSLIDKGYADATYATGGTISGLTTGTIPVATSSSALGNSQLSQSGKLVKIANAYSFSANDTTKGRLHLRADNIDGNVVLSTDGGQLATPYVYLSSSDDVASLANTTGSIDFIGGNLDIGNTNIYLRDAIDTIVKITGGKLFIQDGTQGSGKILQSNTNGQTTWITPSFSSSTLTSAHLFVGNGSNVATDVAMSGDASLANTGAVTVSAIGGKSVTLGGNYTMSGAFGFTGTITANTAVTFPTTGTLATLAGSETFTNKSITSPTVTVGSDATGDIYYNGGSGALTRLADVATGSVLVSGGTSTAPAYSSSPVIGTLLQTPILQGSTSSGGTLTLKSTTNATKGKILFGASAFDEVNNALGIGTASPYSYNSAQMVIAGSSHVYSQMDAGNGSFEATLLFSRNGSLKWYYGMGAVSTANFYIYDAAAAKWVYNASGGKTHIGPASSPIVATAHLQLSAGTATANTAPLKLTSGTNLTTPEAGAVEFDGTNYFATASTTRYTIAKTLTATGTLDFGSTAAGASTDLTITVTGAADGDPVIVGTPNGSTLSNGVFTAWVSATNTVTVRFSNTNLVTALDPASGTFRASVVKY